MARVLLVGESWFVYSVHQKGFDAFSTSEYTEGGSEFIAALEAAGHTVSRIPSHLIERDFPRTAAELSTTTDVLVISDIGANSFQLTSATFTHSRVAPDRIQAIREFTEAGGGLLMVGGYMTFSGIDAKARWGRTVLADILPVWILDRDDRVELPAGVLPEVVTEHPIVSGLEAQWPTLLGYNEVAARESATLIAQVGADPLLVVGEAGGDGPRPSHRTSRRTGPHRSSWPGTDMRRCSTGLSAGSRAMRSDHASGPDVGGPR